MAAATTPLMSPRAHATMSRLDRSIVAVHEDSPEPSAVRRMTEGATANLKMLKSSNQRAKNQFRPRVGKGGATSYQLRQYAEVTLGGGSLRKVVKLPEGEDENEWLAVNSMSMLYHHQLRPSLTSHCSQWSTFTTKSTCSTAPLPSFARRNHAPR